MEGHKHHCNRLHLVVVEPELVHGVVLDVSVLRLRPLGPRPRADQGLGVGLVDGVGLPVDELERVPDRDVAAAPARGLCLEYDNCYIL